MKVLKQIAATAVVFCLLALPALGVEPQKDKEKPPPPKERQEVRVPDKPPPPRENRDSGNKGGNNEKRGKP